MAGYDDFDDFDDFDEAPPTRRRGARTTTKGNGFGEWASTAMSTMGGAGWLALLSMLVCMGGVIWMFTSSVDDSSSTLSTMGLIRLALIIAAGITFFMSARRAGWFGGTDD